MKGWKNLEANRKELFEKMDLELIGEKRRWKKRGPGMRGRRCIVSDGCLFADGEPL